MPYVCAVTLTLYDVCVCVCVCVCVRVVAGALDGRDKQGRTHLMLASSKGLTSVVKNLLLAGASAALTDPLHNTSLMYACKYGHAQTAEALIVPTRAAGALDCMALHSRATARVWATHTGLVSVVQGLDNAGAKAMKAGVDGNSLPFRCGSAVEGGVASPTASPNKDFEVESPPSDEEVLVVGFPKVGTSEEQASNVKWQPIDPTELRSQMHDKADSFNFTLPPGGWNPWKKVSSKP